MLKEIIRERKLPPVYPDTKISWEVRKEEIRKMVCDYEYGAFPKEDGISFETLFSYPGFLSGKAVLKRTAVAAVFNGETYTYNYLSVVPKRKKNRLSSSSSAEARINPRGIYRLRRSWTAVSD